MRADAIRVARVSPRLAGAPRLRSTLERWLADCDPSRHGLPPQAIVMVRRLRSAWSDVAADDCATRYGSFATLLGGARRPASGDADADVVWFADEAELLACIARDALAGALHGRWWWRALATGAWQAAPDVARWLNAPRHVPHAVQRLGAARARSWFARWPPREQAAMLTALRKVYPIAGAVADWVLEGGFVANSNAVRAADVARAAPPAAAQRGHVAAEVSTLAERLHTLCAALAEDASAARVAESEARFAARAPARRGVADARASATPVACAEQASKPAIAPDARATSADDAARQVAPPQRPPRIDPSRGRGPEGLSSPPEPPRRPAPPTTPNTAGRATPVPDSQRVVDAVPSSTAVADERLAAMPDQTSIRTRHGGLMFVLNAALQLSLYGDFTQPAHPGLPCTPWRFLWLAGRHWCGPSFRADPLAAWLVKRDARTEPGPAEAPATDWRIAAAWLVPFASPIGAWRARWQEGRFTLMHPGGFIVCDLTATSDRCESLIAGEAARLGLAFEHGLQRTVLARRSARPARRHLPRHACPEPVWTYLRARLALALDGGRTAAAGCRLGAMLNLPAQLRASGPQRIDLHFSLDSLPLAARFAGLDRDPGWIPSAGCDIRFHFG